MQDLSYMVTVSRAHLIPAILLLRTLRQKTTSAIVVVGNLLSVEADRISALGVNYIDEGEIDLYGRFPVVTWESKYRSIGWYKQMLIRLSIDRFMKTEQVVILDSEVFVFDNWDESRLFDNKTGAPRCFYWIPSIRKGSWDYMMYRGAAYLLASLPEFANIDKYANSDIFRRHISGVVLFSTRNVAYLWHQLEIGTSLEKNLDTLFNHEPNLLFSDHDFYGIAVDYGFFEPIVPTILHENLLGWYDNHDDPAFHSFKSNAMWSMCQRYIDFPSPEQYLDYAKRIAASLGAHLPQLP